HRRAPLSARSKRCCSSGERSFVLRAAVAFFSRLHGLSVPAGPLRERDPAQQGGPEERRDHEQRA
ncbi:hypothetical protein ABZ726_37920, partial [Streptomyces hundungensis]|uniref:hypothetical protein n=1 Tax=Streptomyces hundungensis TaxID=1077946 RepID=UPI0033E3985E